MNKKEKEANCTKSSMNIKGFQKRRRIETEYRYRKVR